MTVSTTAVSSKHSALPMFFFLTFAITWALWVPAAAASHDLLSFPISPILVGLLGAFGPSLAGIITAARFGELRTLLKQLLIWRVGLRWYAFVLLWPAALSLMTTAIHILLGGEVPDFAAPPVLTVYPVPPEAFTAGPWVLLPFIFLQQTLIGSSMGEELGWRGFALPRLQKKRYALTASIIVGLTWGVWHLPKFLIVGDPLAETFFGWFLLGIMANAILFTWVYNNTGGSLLVALLFHTSINITYLFLAPADTNPLLTLILEWALAVVVIAYAGPAHLSRQETGKVRLRP